eukprot:CAMPEP_0202483480 /NCGR_PEP_ID=MMETSP1361-20130828/2720_1 /ASSEMBLY_ACC=CAM_ASM_000849 /TAXON_ID=210615 /ORGANISM="Staurosira complex sp., Strain CCMP2646" /LENGTH=411 /DNA_ID=CAMNT_0049111763 /DNA_START=46 /DNA_END=1282 /DNA_ORIENTATION=+
MSDSRGTIPTALTPLETFIRILPSILLFTILMWCCCKGEAPNSTNTSFESSPADRQARREAMESQLIIKNVIRASPPSRRPSVRLLTSSDRAYSSFFSAIRIPNASADVKFSEDCSSIHCDDDESLLIIQAEEGKLHVATTDQDNSPHAASADASAGVHFSDSTIHNQAGKQQQQQQQQEQQNVDDNNEDADTAARQALASDADEKERDSSLLSCSNRTSVSWVPSEEEDSSCSSEHHYHHQQQQEQQQQLPEQPLALPPPTTTPPTLRLVRRRKCNIIARTISMSLRSSISSLQQQQQQQPTTCDICLMDIKWENKFAGHPMMNVFTVFIKIVCWTGSCRIQNVQSVDEIILSNTILMNDNNDKKKKQARMQEIVMENLNRRKCVRRSTPGLILATSDNNQGHVLIQKGF